MRKLGPRLLVLHPVLRMTQVYTITLIVTDPDPESRAMEQVKPKRIPNQHTLWMLAGTTLAHSPLFAIFSPIENFVLFFFS